ncbi:hypothetical protein FS749_004565 [Ceratobasidium sp. UAMH 11750]|nr:hypothetical protein FS749_004565 [Ceratobasidium sp. UAMH 11750]
MATALAPNPVSLRRRTVGNGTLLLANEAAALVNVPAVGNATRVLRELAKSLKAPKANDEDAQEQNALVERYGSLLESIADRMSQPEGVHFGAESLALFQEFSEYLVNASSELQTLQDESLVVKFTSQTEIKHRLDAKREEIFGRILMFSFENGLLVNHAVARSQADFERFVESVNRRFEDEKLGSEEIKRLVAYEVSAALQARQTDGQSCVLCIALDGHVFFFYHRAWV